MKNNRKAFTLVEMLVAVGLVVLMMSLFAMVFQIATSVMSKQKGFAENDQRARTLTILLKADLDKRTFRRVTALGPTDTGFPALTTGPEDPTAQAGYLYYSENNPYDDTDDVLQFTASSILVQKNADASRYYGHANVLRPAGNTTNVDVYLNQNPNQPEGDDGQAVDQAANSTAAEICYFMRHGTLYRRVMLIRQPESDIYPADPQSGSTGTGTAFMTGGYVAAIAPGSFRESGEGHFYADFDFSAYNDGTGVRFHAVGTGLNSLANDVPNSNASLSTYVGATAPASLATPNLRFGHSIFSGRPREFATSAVNGSTFMGRFTHEETSNVAFAYPGVTPAAANDPWQIAADLGVDGISTSLAGGPRRGEDIVLTNCLSFDVKIFDDMDEDRPDPVTGLKNGILDPGEDYNGNGVLDRVMEFRDLGYAASAASKKQGYYRHGANRNAAYGPVDINPGGNPGYGTDGQPGIAGVDDDGDGTVDNATERGWPGSDDPWNRIFDTWHSDITYLGTGTPPFRPLDNGPDGQPGGPGDDNGISGTNETAERGTAGTDDRHPVKALQIKIRYRDIASGQIRQLTIVQSLKD